MKINEDYKLEAPTDRLTILNVDNGSRKPIIIESGGLTCDKCGAETPPERDVLSALLWVDRSRRATEASPAQAAEP